MFIAAVFGSHKVGRAPWRPDEKIRTLTLFGGLSLDFRQAQLPERGTRIISWSFFGGPKVIVPKVVPVTVSGITLFGRHDVKGSSAVEGTAPGASGLKIKAFTFFGGLHITDEP
ncbi:MAG: hypothetical protein HY678_08945 [Chloroflexi bacterium]|nr:hypothetical protein [Chloroflexota bacterium]